MGRFSRIQKAEIRHVRVSLIRDHDVVLSEVREFAGQGFRVHVTRADGSSFEVVQNGTSYLLRTLGGRAVGTYENVAASLIAGNTHLADVEDARAQREHDFGDDDDHPRGAA